MSSQQRGEKGWIFQEGRIITTHHLREESPTTLCRYREAYFTRSAYVHIEALRFIRKYRGDIVKCLDYDARSGDVRVGWYDMIVGESFTLPPRDVRALIQSLHPFTYISGKDLQFLRWEPSWIPATELKDKEMGMLMDFLLRS